MRKVFILIFCLTLLMVTTGCPDSLSLGGAITIGGFSEEIKPITGAISGKVVILPESGSSKVMFKPGEDVDVTVINSKGELLARTKTNVEGFFIVGNLFPGIVTVRASNPQSSVEATTTVKAGESTSLFLTLGNISAGGPVTITGKVVDSEGHPVVGANVIDITEGEKSGYKTSTGIDGSFSLIIPGLETPRTIEVEDKNNNIITTTSVNKNKTTDIIITLNPNVRTVSGKVRDKVNPKVYIPNATVRVAGTQISTNTDVNGNFKLRGVPMEQVTLEVVDVDGYMKGSTSLESSYDKQEVKNVLIEIHPVGSIKINLQVRTCDPLGLEEEGEGNNCYKCFNINREPADAGMCRNPNKDIKLESSKILSNNNDAESAIYDNPYRFIIFPNPQTVICDPDTGLDAEIIVDDLNIVKKFCYPKTKRRDIFNQIGIYIGTVYDPNNIVTVTLDNIPGGKRTFSVAVDQMETQKSIETFIPPKDTVATELITLYPVRPIHTFGEIVGTITGVCPEDYPNIRVAFLTLDEKTLFLTNDAALTAKLDNYGVGVDTAGNYLLKNVPTGTRIVIAGVKDNTGNYSKKYMPKATGLINVRAGERNIAPPINIEKNSDVECK